jgi:hypothetical protein
MGGRQVKKIILIPLAATVLAAFCPAADRIPNFSGTWIRDTAHSDAWRTPHDSGITSVIPKFAGERPDGAGDTGAGTNPGGPEENDGAGSLEEIAGEWMEGLTLEIVQTDSELQTNRRFFTIDGREKTVTQKFALDGSRCINLASDGEGEFESRTDWKEGKLVHSGTQKTTAYRLYEGVALPKHQRETSVTEEYSISKDGKKLTIKTKSIDPQGATMIKRVFNRRGTPIH